MSGTSEYDADEVLRLVSIKADELRQTSSTARNVLGADFAGESSDNPHISRTSARTACVTVCSDGAVKSTLSGPTIFDGCLSLPVAGNSNSSAGDSAVTGSVSAVQRDPSTKSTRSELLCGSVISCRPLQVQSSVSGGSLKFENNRTRAGGAEILDTCRLASKMSIQSLAPSLSETPCKNLAEIDSADEKPETPKNRSHSGGSDIVASCFAEIMSAGDQLLGCGSILSNGTSEVRGGQLSLSAQQLECNTDYSSVAVDKTCDVAVTCVSDQLKQTFAHSESDDDKTEIEEENVEAGKSVAFRDESQSSISRKPSRIVSFTTEDFDLFQSTFVSFSNYRNVTKAVRVD